jgi:hypothetical protein
VRRLRRLLDFALPWGVVVIVAAAGALAFLWLLRYQLTGPDCGFNCPPASGSVSNAPGS